MLILEKPYVSEFLLDTIVQNDWPVLDNDAVRETDIEEGAFDMIPSEIAKNYYIAQEFPLIYSNSELAQSWVLKNLPDSNLSNYIRMFKDKIAFRDLLKELYPDFYYRGAELEELKAMKPEEIRFPVVVKPASGFYNICVYCIKEAKEWKDSISKLEKEIRQAAITYAGQALSTSKFIIEEFIAGEEYSVDAYFDRDGEPVILNIFQHPTYSDSDVTDRIHLASAGIMIKYMAKFGLLLRDIGQLRNIRNLPIHMELRVTEDGKIIPIEINPMRFSTWCAADVAKYIWGINVYECFFEQDMPDWNTILSNASKDVFYYSIAEVPNGARINGFEYDRWLRNYSNILEVRRIDYTKNPIFALIFGSTKSKEEVVQILSLNTKDYIL